MARAGPGTAGRDFPRRKSPLAAASVPSEPGGIPGRSAPDPVPFVRDLLQRAGATITNLQVRSQTIEETYLAMVAKREAEAARSTSAEATSAGVQAEDAS